jgi:hypothetical protein
LVEAVQRSFPSVKVGLHISGGESDSQTGTDTAKAKTDSLETVVSSANIIITVTPSFNPLFPCSYVSPNTRLILVGSYTPQMHEIDTDLVNRAGIIVVDSKEACGHEAGELIDAGVKEDGLVEIGELLSEGGSAADRVGGQDGVKIFKSVSVPCYSLTHSRSQASSLLTDYRCDIYRTLSRLNIPLHTILRFLRHRL